MKIATTPPPPGKDHRCYSIATGIEFAIVLYVAIKILTGKFKDISFLMVLLAALFIAKEF